MAGEGALIAANPIAEIFRFRELIVLLVGRDLKVRYKRSVLGMFWTLLNPLLQMIVYTLVFSTIMRIGTPRYPIFLLSGLLPWLLISGSTTGAAHSLLNNQGLIKKIAVPQAVYPLALVGSKLVDLVLSLVPLALISLATGAPPTLSWIFLVPALLMATAFAAGLSLLFASLTVFFRDLKHLIDLLFQIWFYLTPILYPASQLQAAPYPWVKSLLALNPAAPIVECFQAALYENRFPPVETVALAAAFSIAALLLGFVVFQRSESRHIHNF